MHEWVSSSHQVAKVLELQLQYQSFQWILKSWFPLGLTGLISLLSKGLSRVFSSTTASILQHFTFFIVQLSHPYMTTGKTIALTRWTFVGKVMSLLFNTLSRSVLAFLLRNKRLLISCLQFMPLSYFYFWCYHPEVTLTAFASKSSSVRTLEGLPGKSSTNNENHQGL